MSPEKLILISNLLIFIGVALGGVGTFGKFYFEKELQKGRIEVNPISLFPQGKVPSQALDSSLDTNSIRVDYNIISTGSGLFEITHAYIEVISFEHFIEKPMQPHGTYGLGRSMDGREASILIEINSRDKFYPIPLFIFNSKRLSSAIFEDNDFSVLQIYYSFKDESRITIRLVIEGNNIRNKSNFVIRSPELTLKDHQLSEGKWVNRGAPRANEKHYVYSKQFYEVLTSGFDSFEKAQANLINVNLSNDLFVDLIKCIDKSQIHYSRHMGPEPGIYLQRCYDIAMGITDSRVSKPLLSYLKKVPMNESERNVIVSKIVGVSNSKKDVTYLDELKKFLLSEVHTIEKISKDYLKRLSEPEIYNGEHDFHRRGLAGIKKQLDFYRTSINEIDQKLQRINIDKVNP